MIKINSVEEFDKLFEQHQGTLFIKAGLSYCQPCKDVSPAYEEASKQLTIPCLEVTVDDVPEIRDRFFIKGVPLFVYFKDGNVKRRVIGVKTTEELIDLTKE
jgi:thioredoxin 1